MNWFPKSTRIFFIICISLVAKAHISLGAEVYIVNNQKPDAVIVIPRKSFKVPLSGWTLQEAATFLQYYIERVTGAKLPIVTETPSVTGIFIALGPTEKAIEAKIDIKNLRPEGYIIKTVPGGVIIAGEIGLENNDRGTLFGIYEFLERVAGIRWYFPGEIGTVISRKNTLILPKLNITKNPFFSFRIGGINTWGGPEIAIDWMPALRYGFSKNLVAIHTEESWYGLYSKTHPEYFGMLLDGTRAIRPKDAFLCYTEPGVKAQLIQNIENYIEKGDSSPWQGTSAAPSGKYIPFGPNDVRNICNCPRCKAKSTPERGYAGKDSDLIFSFVNDIAMTMQQRWPGYFLKTLAYDHYQLPPTKIRRLPDNVIVTLCILPPVSMENQSEILKHNLDIIDQWFAIVGNNPEHLIIWDYFLS